MTTATRYKSRSKGRANKGTNKSVNREASRKSKNATKKKAKPAKKPSRGASRSVEEEENHFPLIRVALALMLIVGGVYLGKEVNWQSYALKAKALVSRPIEDVTIDGEFYFLAKPNLRRALEEYSGGSFVNLDIAELKRDLEAMPWVENVNVSRVWPNGMKIYIKEQKPIARWGSEGFINQFGEIVKTGQAEELAHLPILHGDQSMGAEITRTYMDVAALFSGRGITLKGLELDEKRAWTLVINKDLKLVLGRDAVIEKLRNFLFVYEKQLKQQEIDIQQIDMRYESGLAVKWKKQDDSVEVTSVNGIGNVQPLNIKELINNKVN